MLPARIISWTVLLTSALFIKIFSLFPLAVERYYTNGVYQYIASVQRILFGWIPFSIGDFFYLVIGIYWLRQLIRFIISLYRGKSTKQVWLRGCKHVIFVILLIYVLFNALWGLNYNRLPMEQQMGLSLVTYSTQNLRTVLMELTVELNKIDSSSREYRADLKRKRTLFQEAVETYRGASQEFVTLRYKYSSVKPSLYSYLGNYLGFTGYYNPFSGEAQANTTVPLFVQPFTTCHEIGHQLGYAKENEANFAGFLAARTSLNPAFKYSVYFDMYSYAIREMYVRDSMGTKTLMTRLKPNITEDFRTIRQFYIKYQNPLEPVIRKLYGNYLRANEQPAGMKSYNEVVAMLMAYRKKFGRI
ncbi:MAG: DUF3810 domain-containing protein [Chitinophagaceae bacterium]